MQVPSQWYSQHAYSDGSNGVSYCTQGDTVPQISQFHAMQGFKGQNQYLEANQQTAEQRDNMCCSRIAHNCPHHCILYQLRLPDTIQGQNLAVVQSGGDKAMIQEQQLPVLVVVVNKDCISLLSCQQNVSSPCPQIHNLKRYAGMKVGENEILDIQ